MKKVFILLIIAMFLMNNVSYAINPVLASSDIDLNNLGTRNEIVKLAEERYLEREGRKLQAQSDQENELKKVYDEALEIAKQAADKYKDHDSRHYLAWLRPKIIYLCELLYQKDKEPAAKKELLETLRYFKKNFQGKAGGVEDIMYKEILGTMSGYPVLNRDLLKMAKIDTFLFLYSKEVCAQNPGYVADDILKGMGDIIYNVAINIAEDSTRVDEAAKLFREAFSLFLGNPEDEIKKSLIKKIMKKGQIDTDISGCMSPSEYLSLDLMEMVDKYPQLTQLAIEVVKSIPDKNIHRESYIRVAKALLAKGLVRDARDLMLEEGQFNPAGRSRGEIYDPNDIELKTMTSIVLEMLKDKDLVESAEKIACNMIHTYGSPVPAEVGLLYAQIALAVFAQGDVDKAEELLYTALCSAVNYKGGEDDWLPYVQLRLYVLEVARKTRMSPAGFNRDRALDECFTAVLAEAGGNHRDAGKMGNAVLKEMSYTMKRKDLTDFAERFFSKLKHPADCRNRYKYDLAKVDDELTGCGFLPDYTCEYASDDLKTIAVAMVQKGHFEEALKAAVKLQDIDDIITVAEVMRSQEAPEKVMVSLLSRLSEVAQVRKAYDSLDTELNHVGSMIDIYRAYPSGKEYLLKAINSIVKACRIRLDSNSISISYIPFWVVQATLKTLRAMDDGQSLSADNMAALERQRIPIWEAVGIFHKNSMVVYIPFNETREIELMKEGIKSDMKKQGRLFEIKRYNDENMEENLFKPIRKYKKQESVKQIIIADKITRDGILDNLLQEDDVLRDVRILDLDLSGISGPQAELEQKRVLMTAILARLLEKGEEHYLDIKTLLLEMLSEGLNTDSINAEDFIDRLTQDEDENIPWVKVRERINYFLRVANSIKLVKMLTQERWVTEEFCRYL